MRTSSGDPLFDQTIEPLELVFRLCHLPAQFQNPAIQRLRLFGAASSKRTQDGGEPSGVEEMLHKPVGNQTVELAHGYGPALARALSFPGLGRAGVIPVNRSAA